MTKKKNVLKGILLLVVIIPTLAISSTKLKNWVQKIEDIFVVENQYARSEDNDTDPPSSIILEDNFENNAAGWTFVNSTVNKWYPGFPADFLETGEANAGLYIGNSPDAFEYTTTNAAVSHAIKAFTIPTGVTHVKVSFDWICGGASDFDWDTWEVILQDYMRVWIVPNAFVPTVNVPITVAASNGILVSPEPFLDNSWMVQRERALVNVAALSTQNVKLVVEWINAANTSGTVPAAIRSLVVEDVSCRVIEDLPFVEDFSPESSTLHCWTVVDENEDGTMWQFEEEYFENEDGDYISKHGAVINTDYNEGENDDWLISPAIRLTGNQRLRYSYRVASSNEPNDFRVVLSTTGTAASNFTRVLVPLTAYTNTLLVEETVNLTDFNGDLLTGDVYIAWHVPPGGLDGWKLMITDVVVEDIPLCPLPLALGVTTIEDAATITWNPGGSETEWEVSVQPLNTGIPTANGTATIQPTYTAENLTSNTDYEGYVRAKCGVDEEGEDIFSDWVGPVRLRTTLPLTALPYTEDFENEPNYGFTNGAVNQWIIGSAVSNGGTHALYITNDAGVSNAYDTSVAQVSHAYKDFSIPADAADLTVSFDWRNRGESWSDYFSVWLVPTSFLPVEGRRIGANSGGIQLDNDDFYNQETFVQATFMRDITSFAGQSMRLVFEWRNDSSFGSQPPAAIDNLNVAVTACVRPENLHLVTSTQTTAEIAWTSPPDVTLFDVFVSTTEDAPADNATPTYAGVTNPHTLINLTANTRYYVWIRSACTAANTSFWVGPLDFVSTQVPAELPFTDNFEGNFSWTTDIKQTNRWTHGNAVQNGGTRALYITDNAANDYQYDTYSESTSHVYRDLLIPDDAEEITISYDWKVKGEIIRNSAKDYFRLVKVPTTVIPSSGSLLVLNETNQLVGRSSYVDSEEWKRETTILNVQAHQGQVIRLVFEWINNYYDGEQPPAAIDNVNVIVSTCPSPINPIAEVVRYSSNVRLSWTPQGTETRWEVFTTPQGSPAPTQTTPGILVEGQPSLLLENVTEGEYFEYYVRAICTDANGEQKAVWIGPTPYSYFLPPMCAELDGGIEGIPLSETDTYIICEEGPVTKKLDVSFVDIKKTDDYKVEAIEYNPPFPFFGGDMIDLVEDDEWSDVINLGFDFCFYGKKYDKVLISTNGVITFSIKDLVEGGRYAPTDRSEWSFSEPIPFLPEDEDAPFVDAIFGVFQDSDPSNWNSPEDYSINYQILGTFPCRALVFNMYHVGMYICGYDPDDIEGTTQTSQIVLYEGTNIIEVYVKNRTACMNWQDGAGLIGIQGNDGIQGLAAPNRNTGGWSTSNEAWRFIPDGDSSVDFKWYKDGEVFSTEGAIEVEITENVNYTAKAVYASCEGNDLEIERIFNFVKEDFTVPVLSNYYVCGSKGDGGAASIDISSHKALIYDALGEGSEAKYTVTYYGDEALTTPLDDVIAVATTQRVYVKVVNLATKCERITTFDAIRIAPITVTKVPDVEVCASFELPPLKEGEQYFSQAGGQGTLYHPGDLYQVVGNSTLYVYKKGEQDCFGESSFKVKIHETIVADHIENQVMQCEVFVLPTLSEGNTYHTEPNKGGIQLMEGMEVIVPMTIYVYAQNGSDKVFCSDESSFTVEYEDCPLPKGFSPNGDGINDSFDLSEYGVAKIQIFNRNGVEVYSHGLGYKNEWMGQDKSGNKLPAGTYYYVVVSHGKLKTGWVQLNY